MSTTARPAAPTAVKGLAAIVGFLVLVEFASGILQGYYTPIYPQIAEHLSIHEGDINWFEAAQLIVSALCIPLLARLGLDVLTPRGCQRVLVARGQRPADAPLRGLSRYLSPLAQRYVLISAMQSTGSWLSIVSLRFLSFPAITLAKSSKLVPVLLMNVLLYRRKFAPYKYVVVALVTIGVYMFMALGKPSKKKGPAGGGALKDGTSL